MGKSKTVFAYRRAVWNRKIDTPEVQWSFGPVGPKVVGGSKKSAALIQYDSVVPLHKEFAKDTHPRAAIIAAPTSELEKIKAKYGENLSPAVLLNVRVAGMLPLKMAGILKTGDFGEIASTEGPHNAIGLRHGPHSFYGRIALADPHDGTFYTPEQTALAFDFVHVDYVPRRGVPLI